MSGWRRRKEADLDIASWQWLTFWVLVALTVIGGLYDYMVAQVVGTPATFSGLIRRAFHVAPVLSLSVVAWIFLGIGHAVLAMRVAVPAICPHCGAVTRPAEDWPGGRDHIPAACKFDDGGKSP